MNQNKFIVENISNAFLKITYNDYVIPSRSMAYK